MERPSPAKTTTPENTPIRPKHEQLIILRVIDLPTEVDLSKAKATFNDGTLEVMMPKAAPAKSVRVETKIESPTGRSETAGIQPAFIEDHEPIAKTRAASSRS